MKNIFTYLSDQICIKLIRRTSVLLVFLLIAKSNFAQTITFDLVKAPCNNDGILVIQTTGITLPFDLYIANFKAGYFIDTEIVNSSNFTLYNYSGGYLDVIASNDSQLVIELYDKHPPFTYKISAGPSICPNPLGWLKAEVDGGQAPYNIQWYYEGNAKVLASGDSVNLLPGLYDVLITDARGCVFGSSGNDSIGIGYLSPISLTVTNTTANCTNGSVTVSDVSGGISPYTYHWSNGANTSSISNLTTGEYEFTVTDAQGCVNVGYSYVEQSINIDVNVTSTDATCLKDNGSAIAFGSGGMPPYTYVWSDGQQTQVASHLTNDNNYGSGYYSVIATDSNGCIGDGYTFINSSTPIYVEYYATPSSCTASTGSADLQIYYGTPPYTINWFTYPAQNTDTIWNLAPGVYGFEVADSVGCMQSGSVYVPSVSNLSAYASETDALCTQSNGTVSVLANGSASPFTYRWSNGSTNASISGLSSGDYSCKITDNLGCSVNKYTSVGKGSPINVSFTTTDASCLYANDASITAVATGGAAPYHYFWWNGQVAATANNLSQGNYSVYVTDAAGCSQNGFTYVGYDANNDNCYCTISGTVYNDLNNNCVQDGGEPGVQNIMVHLKGFGYAYTDVKGNYSFLAPTGNYTLSENVEHYYPLASCQDNDIPVSVNAASNCTSVYNFANTINPIHDISIYTYSYNSPVPGNVYQQQVVIKNEGTTTEDSIFSTYADDGQLSTASFAPLTYNPVASNHYTLTPGSLSLVPGASQVFSVNYNVPPNIPLGTVINFNDSAVYRPPMANWLSDYTPWNNVSAYQNVVVGSFDPNRKEVSPIGLGPQGIIKTTDSMLTYTIHFQNTGTYPAQKVVVVDTLDPHLDISTLRPGYSNHIYSTTISERGVLTFTFDNINLPVSYQYPLASIGVIEYSIRQKAGNEPGTQIHSPASIYFDFNAPVRTNRTLNTLQDTSRINGNAALDLNVYPNPSLGGKVNLLINSGTSSSTSTVDIYNLLGQLIQSNSVNLNIGKNIITEDINRLSSGLYFIRVENGQNILVQKLTVIK